MEKKSLYSFKAIISDIDGTLIDSMPIWDDLGGRYLRARGLVPEPELASILFPMTIEEGCRYLKEHYPLPDSLPEIRSSLMQIVDEFYKKEVPLKAGVKEFLTAIQKAGIPMVLTTIGDPRQEEAALRRLGVYELFRKLYVCEEYHTTKKEPKIYKIAASDLGVLPEDTLVIEDMLQAIRQASAAGFYTAAAADAASAADREELIRTADWYVSDLRDLLH
jgi:HAD superfamily hydrolase (TIGR01509 family)